MINENLAEEPGQWNEFLVDRVETLLQGRKALLWVLSDEGLIELDGFEKKAKFELMNYRESKIF